MSWRDLKLGDVVDAASAVWKLLPEVPAPALPLTAATNVEAFAGAGPIATQVMLDQIAALRAGVREALELLDKLHSSPVLAASPAAQDVAVRMRNKLFDLLEQVSRGPVPTYTDATKSALQKALARLSRLEAKAQAVVDTARRDGCGPEFSGMLQQLETEIATRNVSEAIHTEADSWRASHDRLRCHAVRLANEVDCWKASDVQGVAGLAKLYELRALGDAVLHCVNEPHKPEQVDE